MIGLVIFLKISVVLLLSLYCAAFSVRNHKAIIHSTSQRSNLLNCGFERRIAKKILRTRTSRLFSDPYGDQNKITRQRDEEGEYFESEVCIL